MNCIIRELPKKEIIKLQQLWEKLNQVHLRDSIYFKEHYIKFTFEKRFADFEKIDDKNIKIKIIKIRKKLSVTA